MKGNFVNRVFLPDESKKIAWNILISVGVLFSVIITPLLFAFNIQNNRFIFFSDVFIGILFISDIFINLRTAYYDGYVLVTDLKEIRKHYFKTWFFFDLLAATPFFLIPGVFTNINRLVRFIRFVRFLKVFTLFKSINKFKKRKVSSNFIRLFIMAFWLLLTAHFIACGFILVGGISQNQNHFMQYLQAAYWTVTTLATVGYGDFVPDKNSSVQLIYVILAQIVGVGMYGYVIGSVTNVISNIDISKSLYMEKMEKLYAFLIYRRISPDVVKKITDYYDYLWESRRGHDETDIFEGLPKNIKLMVARQINAEIISRVPLFKEASSSCINDILLALRPGVYTPGDIVFEKGDPGFEMFLISRGSVEVVSESDTVIATLHAGDFFGEMSLLFDAARSATVRAKGYCDIFSLRKESFERILKRYPDFAEGVTVLAASRKSEDEHI